MRYQQICMARAVFAMQNAGTQGTGIDECRKNRRI
jgi:hypothetical protein